MGRCPCTLCLGETADPTSLQYQDRQFGLEPNLIKGRLTLSRGLLCGGRSLWKGPRKELSALQEHCLWLKMATWDAIPELAEEPASASTRPNGGAAHGHPEEFHLGV